jgi:hypothetical protein
MQKRKNANTDRKTRTSGTLGGGGGSATQAGIDFQNLTAAWVAVYILAEQAASPPWGLPTDTTLEFLRCETEQPVDDLLVGTSGDGVAFIQVKRSLNLETRESSAFASTLDQFVRQFVVCRGAKGDRVWEHPLDPDRDRLVLLIGPNSPASIRERLPSALNRLSSLAPGQPIEDAARNQQERQALHVVREHLDRSWQRFTGSQLTDGDLRQILSLIRIHILDVESSGTDEREAKNLLRLAILHDPKQADLAWSTLVQACASFASNRAGGNGFRSIPVSQLIGSQNSQRSKSGQQR